MSFVTSNEYGEQRGGIKKMKTYSSFDEWFKNQKDEQIRIISKLRKLVNSVAPKLAEASKWANGVWLKEGLPIIYIHTQPDHVQFGFFAGVTLTDPKRLLRGSGKFVRHIRVERIGDIDEAAFATMVRKAFKAPPYRMIRVRE